MWRNYLTVGLRALAKSRTYAFINIFGLALGLAACLLLLLYVRYETSYDNWLPDADRIYQAQTTFINPETGERQDNQGAPRPTGAALAKDFAEVEYFSKSERDNATILQDGAADLAKVHWVDEPFFKIFQLPFLKGNRDTALGGAETVTLSRSEAIKRFGTIEVLGRSLTVVGDGGPRDLKITGVFEDLPKNSHFDPKIVGRFQEAVPCPWYCTNGGVYVKLRKGADAAKINAQFPAWEKRNIAPEVIDGAPIDAGKMYDWRLVNVADIHLTPADGEKPTNDRGTILTFAVIALLILFMAVVNFTNLATARATQRAREVALRKVLGARRGQLIGQFLGESMLVTMIAMLIALALVELALPFLSSFLEAELDLHYLGSDGVLAPILLLMLVVGLAGGLYPAFYLSRYKPAQVLRANRSSPETAGTGRLRNILVVAQFAISIGLIICTAIVYHQTLFASRSSAGFDREGMIQLEGMRRGEIDSQRESLIREIERIDGVTAVAGSEIVPAQGQTLGTTIQVPGRPDRDQIGWYSVEAGFFEAMGIPMAAGRPLSEQFAKDNIRIDPTVYEDEAAAAQAERAVAERGLNVVLNRAAVKQLGYASPQDAIGKQIGFMLFDGQETSSQGTVVGVAEDTRFRSLREPVEPLIYYDNGRYRRLVIRYQNADPAAVMASVRTRWEQLFPEIPIEAEYTDQKLAELYRQDVRRGQTFAAFALLAVIIACLGLFGLAAFTAERRTMEIGVRKVFGARIRDIVKLLTWQFSRPVVIANIIAWPVAWWIMRDWLNTFDSRIALTPTPFVLAGLLALAIAISTIAGHAIKVARANPIRALRYE